MNPAQQPYPSSPTPTTFINSVPQGGLATPRPYTGAKRGRKPRGAATGVGVTPRIASSGLRHELSAPPSPIGTTSTLPSQMIAGPSVGVGAGPRPGGEGVQPMMSTFPAGVAMGPRATRVQGEEEGEGEDELLPAMADEDYSAQSSWQTESKDNLKVLMENLNPEQYDRFEAYRRHALPKQAVRKVIQQTLGQQVSQPVAQIVAGFSKVFVGEIVEKARQVQSRRRETGPLSPDHLREAYRMYQAETGRVGAARPLSAKRLFVR